MPRRLRALALPLLLLAACAGTPLLIVGESVEPPDPPLRVLVVDHQGAPVAGARVRIGLWSGTTAEDGMAATTWLGSPLEVGAEASGFEAASATVSDLTLEPVELVLSPVVLEGRVLSADGLPFPGASVRLGPLSAVAGPDGAFRLERAVPGEVLASYPAWQASAAQWDGAADRVEITLRPRVVRALYANVGAAADVEIWEELLRMADETGVDGMVVDLKDSSGGVFYESSVPEAQEAGAVRPLIDAGALARRLEEHGLYAIARLVAFEDPVMAVARPELAIWDAGRDRPWRNDAGRAWLDATDPEARGYLIDLAVEVCELGFREIQFDYVRFPTDGPLARARFDGGYDPDVRVSTIAGFLEEAREALHPLGCAVAADIFGFMTSSADDGRIGQRFEAIAASADVISPMLYPSHYSEGWYGYQLPNDHPGPVVARALDDALARVDRPVVVRPWLQAFSFGPGISYGAAQVRAQIQEAETRGMGWMLWNSGSRFSSSALPAAEE